MQESGVVVMGDMARRFKLGSELMHATVTARLGTTIHGRLDSGILYTAAYIARIKAQASRLVLHPICVRIPYGQIESWQNAEMDLPHKRVSTSTAQTARSHIRLSVYNS